MPQWRKNHTKFVVFVGRPVESDNKDDWQLYCLDTTLDKIRLLSKAPDAPPFSKEELEAVKTTVSNSGQSLACSGNGDPLLQNRSWNEVFASLYSNVS